ncbi:endonuclease/exonuclease/phosphatase family protein [Entomohabitans teleogrylli]|uniref:endonuclease/exonuclease/phosphatase family protein n=1 Tax=Entomohabitans teleogrylli TaxID=1384589 RepID=UPI00073D9422|nr:endonuclease/exonuclease/phosphatase family protein [Entomohabitans teleogrylli]
MAQTAAVRALKLLTINTHKGFTTFNRRFILPELRNAVRQVGADIVCLQEVMGAHQVHALRISGWPQTSHYEYLADTVWRSYVYGRNAVYPEGHHGNAVLSRYPIRQFKNIDVSINGHEQRGLLWCQIPLPETDKCLHVVCVHLGLQEKHRQRQLHQLAHLINHLPQRDPVVVAGDFNDWRGRANHVLRDACGLDEVFTRARGRPARTFPAAFPLLRLDRIYIKNASASTPSVIPLRRWRHLSDHAPLAVEILL